MSNDLAALLERAAAWHDHLCPRQVLGVRMGAYAAELLGLDLPQTGKRVFTFVETDGCFADGVAVATGCWLGRRTLRLVDYGKVAATFVDLDTERAIRIRPHLRAREHALHYAPTAPLACVPRCLPNDARRRSPRSTAGRSNRFLSGVDQSPRCARGVCGLRRRGRQRARSVA